MQFIEKGQIQSEIGFVLFFLSTLENNLNFSTFLYQYKAL
jgi:hypothetical protein